MSWVLVEDGPSLQVRGSIVNVTELDELIVALQRRRDGFPGETADVPVSPAPAADEHSALEG